MPPIIKIALSLAVAVAAIGAWCFMRHLGEDASQWIIVFLGPFMIVSLWIFPEVMRDRSDGRLLRHKARRSQS